MIGELRHRLTLQEPVRTPDGGGGFTTSFENIAATPTVYASLTPLVSPAHLQFGQLAPVQMYKIIIRYRPDVTTDMQLTDGDTAYRIVSVTDVEGKMDYLQITASRTA